MVMIEGIDEADYDLLPDYLKEDVESPFGIDDMVIPSDYEWSYLNDDFSVENILKLNKEGKNQFLNLTGIQRRALDKIKDNLYNWDNEPGFSDIFHKEFCKKYDISLSVLRTLEKKGLIKLSKDDYYFKKEGYIVYPKPLMYLVYISEQDYPDWFIPEAKEKGLWKAESKKINPIEKAGISGVASGATIEGLSALMGAEDQSAYWFLKGEMQSRAPLTEMDLEQIMEMLQNVPTKEMDDAIEQAEMMGDEAAMIVLVMADNKRKFREEYASEYENIGTMSVAPARGYTGYMNMMSSARRMVEIGNETGLDQKLGEAYQDESGRWFLPILERKASEEESTEVFKLKSYFSYLKSQKPDLAREIEFSVKNEDELPTQKIYDAGFNPSIIEEWVDLVGVEDENLQGYESCSNCEGEGYVLTSYTSATRFDPADGDGEDCEECGGTGMIDPSDYMDKEGQYYAESFEATEWVGFCPECNKWRTKEMSVKIDSKINTTGWSIPDKLLGKRLCKKSQRFGKIRQSGDTFTGYGSRPFDDSYCGTPLTKVKSKYKTEGFEAETKLSKTSCCCGADEANPCVCMKAPEPMECSAKAPKCACYKALEKNAESFEAEGILCSDCPMAGRHVVIRKDHTDEDGNLICPFCHSNENFKNLPETTYLLHGGKREDLNAETFEAKSDDMSCFMCGCQEDLMWCDLCEGYWCYDECREPTCWDKHYDFTCTRNAAETFEANAKTGNKVYIITRRCEDYSAYRELDVAGYGSLTEARKKFNLLFKEAKENNYPDETIADAKKFMDWGGGGGRMSFDDDEMIYELRELIIGDRGDFYFDAETKLSKTCPNCEKYGRDATTDYICDFCAQCKRCCETSYGCYDVAICNDCDGSFIGKDIDGCCGSCDDCCECDRTYDAESLDDMKIKYGNRDRIFFIKSVDYDTDGEIENDELPQEFTIKIPSNYHYFDEDADEGDITDVLNEWISTETGFSTKGIVWIEEENNSWRKSAEEKESIIKSPYVWGAGIFALTLGLLSRKR